MSERRLRERRQREEAILASALRAFGEKGIRDTTIDDIAAGAELGKGTLYYYFPSKEAILARAIEASVDAHFEGILNRVEPLRRPLDVAEALLRGCAENFLKQPALFRLIYLLLAEPQEEQRTYLEQFNRCHIAWLKELKALIAPALADTPLEVEAFLHFVGTYVHGMMVLAASGRPLEPLLTNSLRTLRQILRPFEEVSR